MYYEIFGPSIQAEKINEEVKTTDEEESIKFMKEQEDKKLEISSLMQCSQLEEDAKDAKVELTQHRCKKKQRKPKEQ